MSCYATTGSHIGRLGGGLCARGIHDYGLLGSFGQVL